MSLEADLRPLTDSPVGVSGLPAFGPTTASPPHVPTDSGTAEGRPSILVTAKPTFVSGIRPRVVLVHMELRAHAALTTILNVREVDADDVGEDRMDANVSKRKSPALVPADRDGRDKVRDLTVPD